MNDNFTCTIALLILTDIPELKQFKFDLRTSIDIQNHQIVFSNANITDIEKQFIKNLKEYIKFFPSIAILCKYITFYEIVIENQDYLFTFQKQKIDKIFSWTNLHNSKFFLVEHILRKYNEESFIDDMIRSTYSNFLNT